MPKHTSKEQKRKQHSYKNIQKNFSFYDKKKKKTLYQTIEKLKIKKRK